MTRAGRLLFWVSMTAWIGGLAALALVAAPVIFKTAPSRAIAGDIFGRVLAVFSRIELACAIAALAGSILLMPRPASRSDWLRPVLLVAMMANVLLILFWLLPTMSAVRDVDAVRFDQLHHLSTKLYGGTLLTGLGVIVLAAWEKRSP
jgi:hypothetical protein